MNKINKTILITGATSGIGKAAAELFLSKSWTVIATGRNIDKLDELKVKGAIVHLLDVSKEEDIEQLVKFINSNQFKIDVLLNNAGFGQFGTIEETEISKAKAQFETNVFGLVAVSQKIIPMMRQNGSGRIINISSIAGKTSMPGGGWYSASKYAVEAISDAMRWETKQFGIKVSIIEPGPIKTEFGNTVNKIIVTKENSPYKNLVVDLTKSTKSIKGGTVKDCASKIYKAATSKRPHNRYLVTKEAKLIKFILAILPPKLLDYFIIKMFISKK